MISAVIGLGFGDEGKGGVVDHLCSTCPTSLVIRYSGGHQAGHCVINTVSTHIFSSFGSGTLRGVPTYISEYCVIYPTAILNELAVLIDKGITPTLYINPNCPVTTPYDVNTNIIQNRINDNGSCCVGIGATYEREKNLYSLQFKDLFYPQVFEEKLRLVQKYYGNHGVDRDELRIFKNNCNNLIKHRSIIKCEQSIDSDIIFEGSQGLLLDQNIGFFPNVTYGNTGTKNILKMVDEIDQIFLVTRAYQTRHGNGFMSNENLKFDIKENEYEINVTNQQGKFRRTMLDIDLLKYAIESDKYISNNINRCVLIITCLDNINEFKYTKNRNIIKCDSKEEFIERICNELDINILNCLISNSPYSEDFF